MAARPITPEEPFIGGSVPSPYLSPWSFGWGLLARFTELDGFDILVVSGLANLALILVAFRWFLASIDFGDRASAVALVCVVALWGYQPWRWSGFVSLNSLGFGLPYPSATGYALMLVLWALVIRVLRSNGPWCAAGIPPIFAATLLSHPFSALNAGLGFLALLAAFARTWDGVLRVVLAVGGGCLLALLWPYYSIVEALRLGEAYDTIHQTFYDSDAWVRISLVFVAVPILVRRWRDDRRDVLVWFVLVGAAAYLAGFVLGAPSLGRALPVALLGAQLGVAHALVVRTPGSAWRVWRWLAVAALLLGLVACLPGLTRAVPRALLDEDQQQLLRFRDPPGSRAVEEQIVVGDVVLVPDVDVSRGLVARGVRVVAPPYVQPFILDAAERSLDVATFSLTDRQSRAAVVERYGVDWVVWPDVDAAWVRRDGIAAAEDGFVVLPASVFTLNPDATGPR